MAIVRYKAKPHTFDFDGMAVGLRRPTTQEMVQISKARAAYIKTVKAELLAERKEDTGIPVEGDMTLLFDMHRLVSTTLCCDPENTVYAWFAKTTEEAETLGKDMPDDVPQAFHTAAFNAFVEQDQKITKEATENAGTEGEGDNKVVPLRPIISTENTTTDDSADKSSVSASGSEDSTPINTSEPGTTATS